MTQNETIERFAVWIDTPIGQRESEGDPTRPPQEFLDELHKIMNQRAVKLEPLLRNLAEDSARCHGRYKTEGLTYSVKNNIVRLKNDALSLAQELTAPVLFAEGQPALKVPEGYFTGVACSCYALVTALVGPIGKRKNHTGEKITGISQNLLRRLDELPKA